MSRYFIRNGSYEYGELPVKEIETGRTFILTQPKTLFNEDFYKIQRFITENVLVDVSEPYFCVYRICWMVSGSVLIERIVSEDIMMDIMQKFPEQLLHGDACDCIQTYFEGK